MGTLTRTVEMAPVAEVSPSVPGTSSPLAKLALCRAEKAAVSELGGDLAAAYVQDRATALSGGDPNVRRRSLARAAAIQEATMQQLAALVAAAIAARDLGTARSLDRILTSATLRYRSLLEQLRIESTSTQRVTMLANGPVAITAQVGP